MLSLIFRCPSPSVSPVAQVQAAGKLFMDAAFAIKADPYSAAVCSRAHWGSPRQCPLGLTLAVPVGAHLGHARWGSPWPNTDPTLGPHPWPLLTLAQARVLLIDAARGLLAGTTNVLTAYDAYEVPQQWQLLLSHSEIETVPISLLPFLTIMIQHNHMRRCARS